jgi:hypothetical protein
LQYDDLADVLSYISCPHKAATTHYGYLEQPHRYGGYGRVFNTFLQGNFNIICLSEGIKNVYKHFGVSDDRLYVVCNGARKDLFRYTDSPTKPGKSVYLAKITDRIFQDGVHKLQHLKAQTQDIIAKLPIVQRTKRFFDIFGAITGTAALGMAFYNAHSISKINDHLQALGDKHNQLVDITHIHQQHLEKLELNFKKIAENWVSYFENNPTLVQNHVNSVIDEIKEKVQLLNTLLEHGIRKQISHSILSAEVLQNITIHTHKRAQNLSLASAIKNPLDLLHMETSYLFTKEEATLKA